MALYPMNPAISHYIQGKSGYGKDLQGFIVHVHMAPALGSSRTIHATLTCGASIVTVTTALTQPDVCRNVVLTGNSGATEVITVNGLDAAGAALSENITLNGATPVVGAKCFSSILSIVTPVGSHTVDSCYGSKLGLKHTLAFDSHLLSMFNNAPDAGSYSVSSSVLASNYYTPAGTLDGSKVLDLFYLV